METILWLFWISSFILYSFPTSASSRFGEIIRTETVENRRIFEFNSYRDVQILRFNVPLDSKSAIWWFKTNHTKDCELGTVSVYLRSGGYPVVNPDGAKFPEEISWRDNPNNLTFNPINGDHSLLVPSPDPGVWFMLVYVNKIKSFIPEEEKNRCTMWLTTKAEYKIEKDVINLYPEKHDHQELILYHSIDSPQTYKFFTGSNIWSASVNVSKCRVKSKNDGSNRRLRTGSGTGLVGACPIRITAGPRRPPDSLNPGTRSLECIKEGDICSLKLLPQENSWHYVSLSPTKINKQIEFAISVTLKDCPYPTGSNNYLLVNRIDLHQICKNNKNGGGRTSAVLQLLFPPYQRNEDQENQFCGERVRLDRITLPGVFAFEYRLPFSSSSEYNSTKISAVSNSFGPIFTEIRDRVSNVFEFFMETSDIGGTLVVEVWINKDKLIGRNNDRIVLGGCLSNGYHFEPELEGDCGSEGHNLSLNVSLQSTDDNPFQRILIPYPSSGMWYLTLKTSCSRKRDHSFTACSRNKTPLIMSVYSSMCVMGSCGKYGRCYQFFSGGNMFSTCSCIAGYKGWNCADDSTATSEIDLLAATLLLCLSNLLFLPAVGLAIYRGFYTESFIYFSNMIFSTLYHACDQDIFSFCLMKYTVLQFCDFYTATMAYWVTVLAMGGLPEQAKSLLHMVGAVGVALAVEYDRTGVLTFVVPGIIGLVILFASWITHCSSDRSCYPGLKYTCCFFLPGVCVVTVGIFAFAFLERESNYHFVHSAWHCSMAISILFLLPQSTGEKEEKYTVLDSRGGMSSGSGSSSYPTETSFKHYSDGSDHQVFDVTTRNGGGSVSMPGTLLRTKPTLVTSDHRKHHYHHHHPNEPS